MEVGASTFTFVMAPITATNFHDGQHFNKVNFVNRLRYKHRVMDFYIFVAGDYGYSGLQGHDDSYRRNSRLDTSKGWREWRLRRCACPLRFCV